LIFGAVIKQLRITTQFWKEDNLFFVYTPELDIVSQGENYEEAEKNLYEVIEINFEEMKKLNTLSEFLKEKGFNIETSNNIIYSKKEVEKFSKDLIQLYGL
jgi:predicted RNase H-like HicB family nuclease